MLAGNIKEEWRSNHNGKDFIGFLKNPEEECEQGKEAHIIVDS
jgi:hypothetical protein